MVRKKKKSSFGSALQRLLLPSVFLLLIFYIFAQLFTGERGLIMWNKLQDQVADLEQQNLALQGRIVALEDKTQRLKGDIDVDYMDEQIRLNLPVAKGTEKVVLINKMN